MPLSNLRIDLVEKPGALDPKAPIPGDGAIEAGLLEIGQLLERLVKQGTPTGVFGARGGLLGSIFSEPRGNPVREVVTGSTALYAPIVERGRAAGKFPPIAPLELWVERKLGISNPEKKRAVAFAIATKLKRVGFRGAKMFETAFREGQTRIAPIAERLGRGVVIEWRDFR